MFWLKNKIIIFLVTAHMDFNITQSLGRVAQLVTCLAKYLYLVADPGVMSSIPAWFCLFLLLYVPSQQLWSLRDGQFT